MLPNGYWPQNYFSPNYWAMGFWPVFGIAGGPLGFATIRLESPICLTANLSSAITRTVFLNSENQGSILTRTILLRSEII